MAHASSSKLPPTGIMTGTHSGDSAPRHPEAKTPRKVQWLDHTIGDSPAGSTHALDEQGIDPTSFQTLTSALERHKSQEGPGPRTNYFSAPRRTGTAALSIDTDQPPVSNEHSAQKSTATTPSEGAPSGPPSPTRDIPGNYIGGYETAGLPNSTNIEETAHRVASNVVRSHTRKGFMGGFGERRRRHNAEKAAAATASEDKTVPDDMEKSAATAAPINAPLGGGVLSALLNLYNQQNESMSLPSTPGLEPLNELPWITPPQVTRKQSSPDSQTSVSPPLSKSATAADDSIGRSHHSRAGSTASLSKFSILPQKPKSKSGALGALIASTGNISGAAAPTSSQLAPNIKRPGYHLSRYSWDEDVPKYSAKVERPKSLPPAQSSTAEQAIPASEHRNSKLSELAGSLASKRGWQEKLKDIEHLTFGGRSGKSTPGQTTPSTSMTDRDEWLDEKAVRDQEQHRREKRRKRKKAEVYITRHVAQIIQRQEFILKLARAMMMFGGPSHRLQAQIQSTGRVLDIQVNCMYLPDVILISFDDSSTGTSNLKFIRQASSLDLGKLPDAYSIYWKVIHDEISVSEASSELDNLMVKRQLYNWWQLVLTGGFCSSAICTVSFGGSFIDALMSFPLGALLVAIQLISVRNELYSNIFEITMATLFSFISAALAATHKFCYSAIASSSVVLILPGFIVLCGSLEIMSRNIVSGSVRMCYAVVYSLFLGFGLAMGAEAYQQMTGHPIIGSTDYTCSQSHDPSGPWYQRTPSEFWAFLTVPMYSLFLSMRNQAPWNSRQMLLLIAIASIGWVTDHFTSTKFPNQTDVGAAVGAFAVGVVANVYARFFSGNAFVIMITGILFQLPSGLGNGGLLTYASQKTADTTNSYLSGFQTALQLISVAIGLAVGLGLSLVVVHPFQSKRRGGAVFSL